jgi:20S proteasome alpha/beta subunit
MAMTELRTAIPEEIDRYLDSLVSTGPFSSKAELVRAALAAYTSMAGPMAQVFDKDNIYSPDGRVYQMDYARESALRGPTVVGITYQGGVLLACKIACPSPLMEYSKIERVSSNLTACPTGVRADGYMAIRTLRKNPPKTLADLIDSLTVFFWENNTDKRRRPLGTILLIAALLEGKPSLVMFEPSGAHVLGKAIAIGKGYQRAQANLNLSYRSGTAKEAENLAIDILGKLEKTEKYEIVHLKR